MKAGFNRSCFLLQLDLGNVSCLMRPPFDFFLSLSCFSLFLQSTSFESSLFFTLKNFGSSLFRERARSTRRWSFILRARLSIFVSKFVSFFLRVYGRSLRLQSWRRGSILRPSERMSCIPPQDHCVLAILLKLQLKEIHAPVVRSSQLNYQIFFSFFVSALLQDCSLCWDRWNGT